MSQGSFEPTEDALTMTSPTTVTDSWITSLKGVDTPTLSNAIELLKLRPCEEGFAPLELRCLFPELGRMCGYAVTAQVETVTRTGEKLEQTFLDLFEAVERSPKPAVVVLQETGERPSFATHLGEVMSTIFKAGGAVGMVSDAGIRDLDEVRSLGFQCFARGAVPSHANFRIVCSSVPVNILGLPVRPGDILHGDLNGLIHVPDCSHEELFAAVEKIRSSERTLMESVRREGFRASQLKGRLLH